MKKKPVSTTLRDRIAGMANPAERVDPTKVMSLGKDTPPLRDRDILVEEHSVEGKKYICCPSLSEEARDRYLDEYRQGLAKGMQGPMVIRRKPLFKGRLFETMDLRYPVHISALTTVGSGISSFEEHGEGIAVVMLERESEVPRLHVRTGPEGEVVVLDLARVLEDAIAKVSFFRRKAKDRYPLYMFSRKEAKTLDPASISDRLDSICRPQGVVSNQKARERLRGIIGPMYKELVGTDTAVSYVFKAVKFEDKVVASSRAEDEVDHVIALCNRLARSSVILGISTIAASSIMNLVKVRSAGYTEEWQQELLAEVIGKTGEMAFASPYVRIADMCRRLITEGPRSKEDMYFKMSFADTMRSVFQGGIPPAGDMDMHSIYPIDEAEWRESAASTLEDLSRHIGFSFHSVHGILDTMEAVNQTDFVSRENLPRIAAVWRSSYG